MLPIRKSFPKNHVLDKIVIIIVVIGLALIPFSVVHAASWARGTQGDCSGNQPKGDAWINWDGQTFLSWGEALENLFWWNGSSWIKYASDDENVMGASGVAWAHSTASYRAGNWQVVGVVRASFSPFNGYWSNQDNYDYTCP